MGIHVVSGLPGFVLSPRKQIILIIHYNQHGYITPCLFSLIQSALKISGSCILVSTSLSRNSRRLLAQIPVMVVERANIGYDFGSLKDIYFYLRDRNLLDDCQRMIVLNNSMLQLGPVDLTGTEGLRSLLESNADLQGITDSYETGVYHIQSYHFSLSRRAIFSSALLQFFLNYEGSFSSREYAIERGELCLTHTLLEAGLTAQAWLPVTSLTSIESVRLMKTTFATLRELLEDSPHQIQDVLSRAWQDWLPTDLTIFNPSLRAWPLLLLLGYPFVKRQAFELGSASTAPLLVPLFSSFLGFDERSSDLVHLPLLLRLAKVKKALKVEPVVTTSGSSLS